MFVVALFEIYVLQSMESSEAKKYIANSIVSYLIKIAITVLILFISIEYY